MDGIANVAKQQQTQVAAQEFHGRTVEQNQQVQPTNQNDQIKISQQEGAKSEKINSQEEMKQLVDQLNNALAPMNTELKFGVDSSDIFYVGVFESKTNKMIRRFPAEEAVNLLPKIQEISGVLFDSKG